MTGHKHHLIENGTVLLCDAFGCPTHGKPFLLAGGDATTGDAFEDEHLSRLATAIGAGIKAELKTKELERKLQELQEENLRLKEIL